MTFSDQIKQLNFVSDYPWVIAIVILIFIGAIWGGVALMSSVPEKAKLSDTIIPLVLGDNEKAAQVLKEVATDKIAEKKEALQASLKEKDALEKTLKNAEAIEEILKGKTDATRAAAEAKVETARQKVAEKTSALYSKFGKNKEETQK